MMLSAVILALQAVATPPAAPAAVPFGVGERLEYGGKFTIWNVGTAELVVEAIDTVRGVPSWRFAFNSEVSVPLYKQQSEITSWTGVGDWISRRFTKEITENGKERHETFRIYPDSGFFRRNDNAETKPTPARPLDDIAFMYWVRTIPLEVKQTYRFNNYFRAEHNPVVVKVEKREMRELPDGTRVPALLLRPIVREEGGMFSEKSKAKLWITDDERRIPLEIESTYAFGTVKLSLKKITLAPGGG